MKRKNIAMATATVVAGSSILLAAPATAQDRTAVVSPRGAVSEVSLIEGPTPSVDLPTAIRPGDSAEVSVVFDNTDGADITNWNSGLTFDSTTGELEGSHITLEQRDSEGNWQSLSLRNIQFTSSYTADFTGPTAIAAGERLTLDLRIGFTSEAPETRAEIILSGAGDSAAGAVGTPATSFYTSIDSTGDADEVPDEEDPDGAPAPEVTLAGVPAAGFVAGGDWQGITLRVDNSGLGAFDAYDLGVNLGRGLDKGEFLTQDQIMMEVQGLGGDSKSWSALELDGSEELHSAYIGTISLAADEQREIRLRLRFAEDTPTGPLSLATVGWAPDSEVSAAAEPHVYRTEILAAGTGESTGATAGTGGSREDGSASAGDKGAESSLGGAGSQSGNDPAPNGGGKDTTLAVTGSNAATPWIAGAAGIVLAMGTAMLTFTIRRRSTTA
ncbi:hypothetical protein JJV70_05635 [Streptomyces sp. JJ66]|uniref:hypothetical protein n=1 Tax=Streptomyces sp. JJ66 TaxID=2803843 RepID=UPI001C58B84E|nr:hypothetical protein [Streptomyces sp. JJ66]MBW1601597.1 hypothetical protein [Streptomyces sp. JJ66]